jgi:phosphoribosyl 1,2-cyclic phosphodiesterase
VKLRFRVLGSGSSGNATLIESGDTRILLDAGLGPRELAERLKSAGVEPDSLTVILLSHEHQDHSRGAASFSRKWGVRVCGTRGTYAAAGLGAEGIAGYDVLEPGVERRYGCLQVLGVRIPHDAAAPVAFVVSRGEARLGHATDLGHVTASLVTAFQGCQAILMESNYDPGMLRDGPYPWSLKERILSPHGHLSNGDVARYLATGLSGSCKEVVLAHLSEKNNHPEVARMAADRALESSGRDARLSLTDRDGTGWIDVAAARRPETPPVQMRLWSE